jgi:hypothetical protein
MMFSLKVKTLCDLRAGTTPEKLGILAFRPFLNSQRYQVSSIFRFPGFTG